MKKRVLVAIYLCIAMIFSTIGTVALADDTVVATVGDTEFTDLQEAIIAAAPDGTVEIVDDVTVDKWVMFAQNFTIGNNTIITLDMDGLTINGNNHSITVNSIESANNGNHLFSQAENLNISDLTINIADGVAGGISLESGTIENVTFNGGSGVFPGEGEITINECEFNTANYTIYYESARDNLAVTSNTFDVDANKNVILLYGNETFTGNTIESGRTVNVVSGSPTVSGNIFADGVRLKVYNEATATIEDNTLTYIVFDDETAAVNSTFENNLLSVKAYETLIAADSSYAETNTVRTEGTVTIGYTASDRIWGEGGGNANESLVVELYEGEDCIATASLNNVVNDSFPEGIIDGDVYVTWSMPFDGEDSDYWDVEWAEGYPNAEMKPDTVAMVIDETRVATNDVQLNAPDDLNKIVAAAEKDGEFLGYFTTLTEAMGKFNGRTVVVLRDVEEAIEGFYGVTLTTNVEDGVSITNTDKENWIDFDDVTLCEGVTVNSANIYSGDSENVIYGTLNVEDTYYHGYDAKTTVMDGGKIAVDGTTILRYNEDAEAGLYIYGDGDDETVEFFCSYYIGAYSGTFYAEDATIEAGYFLLKNSYDAEKDYETPISMTLDNSSLEIIGTGDGQDSFITDSDASLTLMNGSSIKDVRDFNVLSGSKLDLSVDSSSSMEATNVNIADDVALQAKINSDGTVTITIKLTGDGSAETPYLIDTLDQFKGFRDAVNAGETYKGKIVKLTDDIDLDGEEWTPIGNSTNNFKGTFDGDNHTISNLVVNMAGKSNAGLFGMTTDGEIKNLTVENAEVTGRLNVGVVAGTPYTSKYTNITVTGHVEVNGMAYVGGVGGKNAYANWTDITVDVDDTSYVKATSTENGTAYRTYVGGVIGFIGEGGHTFKNITSNTDVIGDVCDVGGITGIAHYSNNFVNVSCTGDVTNTNSDASDVLETGLIAGVWHNQKGYEVEFTDISATGTISTPNVQDVVFDNGGLIGAAYTKNNDGDTTSGTLIIEGEKAWPLVAELNGEKYGTLAAAIEKAESGDTVTLLSDAIQKLGIVITDKNITIDLGGNTFEVTEGDDSTVYRNFLINGSSVVTIRNGTIISKGTTTGTTGSGVWGSVRTEGSANVTLEELELYNYRGNGLNVKALGGTTVTINDTNIYSQYGGGVESAGGTVELNNVNVEQTGLWTAPYNSMAISVNGGGTVIVNSGNYTTEPLAAADAYNQGTSHGSWAVGVLNSGGTLIINDGTFANGNFGDDSLATAARGLILADTAAKIELNGGTFNALKSIFDIQNNLGDAANNPTAVVSGGTFTANPVGTSNLVSLADGYMSTQSSTTGLYYVSVDPGVTMVAQVNGGTKYQTLEAAIAAARDGDTINLLTDIELTETLVLNKEGVYVIDGNGYKISPAEGYTDKQNALIMVGASGNGYDQIATHNYTFTDVVFEGTTDWSVIRSQGATLTVDGCTIQNCQQTNGQSLIRLDYTEATIKNTTIKGNNALMAIAYNFNCDDTVSKLLVDECVVSDNTFNKTAAIYYVTGGGCQIKNSEFINNDVNCNTNGAVIYLGFQEDCSVTGCLFQDNDVVDSSESTRVAGAIFFGYEAEILGNAFINNTATNANGSEGLGQSVCTSTYYDCTIDLSSNYFNGAAPVEGVDYHIQHKTGDGRFELADYYTEYELDSDGNVVLSEVVNVPVVATVDDGEGNVTEYTNLQYALEDAVVAGDTVMVTILENIDLTDKNWTPVYFNSYSADGANTLVIDGNHKTITGLSDMLFSGVWTGKKLEVRNLTLDGANIVNDAEDTENKGVGAIVGNVSAIEEIVLSGVTLTGSHVEGGHWTGGLIGYAAGYSGNDGPVFTTVTITDCAVTGSTITGKGSVGGIVGHATGDAWTSFGVEETEVKGNVITSTGSSANKAGIVMGTIGAAGTEKTTNDTTLTGGVSVSVTESGNAATSNGTVITTVYGRQGSSTGVLTITGGTYENMPIEEDVEYAAPKEGYKLKKNSKGYGIVQEGTSTGGGASTPEYSVTVNKTENGTVKVNRTVASKGQTITVTITPDEGYKLDTLVVIDKNGNEITLTEKAIGEYTFEMPYRAVTITATFAKADASDEQDTECTLDETCPMYDFGDLASDEWYHDGVHYAIENGLMNGMGEGEFAPAGTTSRAMIVTILWRLEGSPTADFAVNFEDVEADTWYTEAVRWAASEKIVEGYGDGIFGTNDNITREQMATIMYRYAQYKGYEVSVGENTNILSYGDAESVSDWAVPAMQWACGAGLINGIADGDTVNLEPNGSTTRAQAATILYRFCEAYKIAE